MFINKFNQCRNREEYDIHMSSIITTSVNHGEIDALIYNHPCFHRNTRYIGLTLVDEDKYIYNSDDSSIDYLVGLRYSFVMGNICIYQGILTEGNLFPVKNVPLKLVTNTEIALYIHNINIDPNKYILRLIHYESLLEYSSPCKIVWSPFTESKNYLMFNTGIGEPSKIINKYPVQYIQKYATPFNILGLKCMNVNHFYNHHKNGYRVNNNSEIFCTPNCIDRTMLLLSDISYTSSFCDMISDTFIVPVSMKNKIYVKSIICTSDAITNIEIITKKDVTSIIYSVSSERIGFNKNFEANFIKIKNEYRVICCNDHMHLITIGDIIVTINIIVDISTGFMSSISNWRKNKKSLFGNSKRNMELDADIDINIDIQTDIGTNDHIDNSTEIGVDTEINNIEYTTTDVLLKYDRFTYGTILHNKWVNIIKNSTYENLMPNNCIACVTEAPFV